MKIVSNGIISFFYYRLLVIMPIRIYIMSWTWQAKISKWTLLSSHPSTDFVTTSPFVILLFQICFFFRGGWRMLIILPQKYIIIPWRKIIQVINFRPGVFQWSKDRPKGCRSNQGKVSSFQMFQFLLDPITLLYFLLISWMRNHCFWTNSWIASCYFVCLVDHVEFPQFSWNILQVRNVFGCTCYSEHKMFKVISKAENDGKSLGFVKPSECWMTSEIIIISQLIWLKPLLKALIMLPDFLCLTRNHAVAMVLAKEKVLDFMFSIDRE